MEEVKEKGGYALSVNLGSAGVLMLMADTEEERENWIRSFREALKRKSTSASTGPSSLPTTVISNNNNQGIATKDEDLWYVVVECCFVHFLRFNY